MAAKLESDLRETVEWGSKWLVDFNTGKTQFVSFEQSGNTGATDVEMDRAVLEEKLSFQRFGCLFLLNWIVALTRSLLLKLL